MHQESGVAASVEDLDRRLIAATARFTSTRVRTGPRTWVPAVRITVNNAAEAALPAAFSVGYVGPAGGWNSKVHQAVPGETVSVTVSAQVSGLPVSVWVAFPLASGPNAPGGFYMWTTPPLSTRRR